MRKEVLAKIKLIEDYIAKGDFSDASSMLQYMNRWIGYIQHERLIHLIVTVTFAILTLLCFIGFFISQEILFLGMSILFIVTTAFYVEHYYLLENKTQYLYKLYDKIEKNINKAV